jgi:hypothetical protein
VFSWVTIDKVVFLGVVCLRSSSGSLLRQTVQVGEQLDKVDLETVDEVQRNQRRAEATVQSVGTASAKLQDAAGYVLANGLYATGVTPVFSKESAVFQGIFNPDIPQSFGVFGTFDMWLSGSKNTYSITLDLTNAKFPPPISNPIPRDFKLEVHLHVGWEANGAKDCSAAATGGHQDTFYACSPVSAYYVFPGTNIVTPDCLGKSYVCSPDKKGGCETGDITGRYGLVEVITTAKAKYVQWAVDSDLYSPLLSRYASNNKDLRKGGYYASVVFHEAGTGIRLFCAKIEMNSMKAAYPRL